MSELVGRSESVSVGQWVDHALHGLCQVLEVKRMPIEGVWLRCETVTGYPLHCRPRSVALVSLSAASYGYAYGPVLSGVVL